MLDAAVVSLFHSLEQVSQLTRPCRRTLPVRYGRDTPGSCTRRRKPFPLDRFLELAVLALLEVADRDYGRLGPAEQLLEP